MATDRGVILSQDSWRKLRREFNRWLHDARRQIVVQAGRVDRMDKRAPWPPVMLRAEKLVYETSEPFGAGIDHKFSQNYSGVVVWSDQQDSSYPNRSYVGDPDDSGVEITTDETWNGAKLKLKAGMWRIDLSLLALGYEWESGVTSFRNQSTTGGPEHEHTYSQFYRVAYETAIARLWVRKTDSDSWNNLHVWAASLCERTPGVAWQFAANVGGAAIFLLSEDDYQLSIDITLSDKFGDSVAGLDQSLYHSYVILQRLHPRPRTEYLPTMVASGGPEDLSTEP